VGIETNYEAGKDTLACKACYSLGVDTAWLEREGILILKGSKSMRVYGQAIASIEFKTSSSSGNERVMTWTYGPAFYSFTTGRYYRHYTPAPGTPISWAGAQAECEKVSIFGLTGYLMTVTSTTEDKLAKEKVSGSGWMGAKSQGNTWRWATGP
jgi:hypothetical protein